MATRGPQRDELQNHVFNTYLSLRTGLWVTGALLPIAVWVIGWALDGVTLAKSISAYYWTTADVTSGEYRARAWLVGGLFAVASGLYLYKGFTNKENITLNLAAIFALGVAVFPTTRPRPVQVGEGFFTVHGVCALLLFACLVFVVWFCAQDTLHLLSDRKTRAFYLWWYRAIGLVMVASPLLAVALNALTFDRTSFVFWVEAAGIWAFAAYWYVKSRELKRSQATRRALKTRDQAEPLYLYKEDIVKRP